MICWFESGLTDSVPGPLTVLPGLGWVSGGACPHYDGEAARRPSLHAQVASGAMGASWAADDGAALHFIDEQFHCAVSSRSQARAWRVACDGDQGLTETALATRHLG
jgi:peptidase E